MLHYFRTQTLTKDYSEFLVAVLRSQQSDHKPTIVAEQMIKTNLKVLLEGVCTPLGWLCAKTMQKR